MRNLPSTCLRMLRPTWCHAKGCYHAHCHNVNGVAHTVGSQRFEDLAARVNDVVFSLFPSRRAKCFLLLLIQSSGACRVGWPRVNLKGLHVVSKTRGARTIVLIFILIIRMGNPLGNEVRQLMG